MQIVNVEPDELIPLLDAIGSEGVYVLMQFQSERQADEIRQLVESKGYYR